MATIVILLVAIVVCIICVVKHYAEFSQKNHIKKTFTSSQKRSIYSIPGPLVIPGVGTKWIFFVYYFKYKIANLHKVYAEMNLKYGDIVLEVLPFGIPLVHLFGKEDLDKVLKYPSKYPLRPPTGITVTYRYSRPDRYCSLGIVNEQGPTWHKLRSSLVALITSPRVLQDFMPAFNCICDDFVQLLQDQRNPSTNDVENFEDLTNLMALEAICMLTLGRRMGFLAKNFQKSNKVKELSGAVKELFIAQRDSYYGLGLWKYLPTQTYKRYVNAEELIYNSISEIVEKALREHCNTSQREEESDSKLQAVFLHIINSEVLDIRDKKSAIVDFIAAGIETLSNTLIFLLHFVTGNEKASGVIIKEFENNRNSPILQDDVSKATYTRACIQESYRIKPTAISLARILEIDMELSGYYLRAGTVVLCHNMIACDNDVYFKDAKVFRPERWIDKNGKFTLNIKNSSIVAPFGIGRRMCPGKRFVDIQLILLLAKLVLKFDITFKEPLKSEFRFLLGPKQPVAVNILDHHLNERTRTSCSPGYL